MVDASGEVAFEAADGFKPGFGLSGFAVQVGAGGGVAGGAGDGDDVDGAVELAVAAAVQPVAVGVAGAGGDRGGAGVTGKAGVAAESLGAGGVADDDRGGDGAAAGLGGQLGRVRVDQGGELGEEFVLFVADLVDAGQGGFGDSQPGAGRQPAELAGQLWDLRSWARTGHRLLAEMSDATDVPGRFVVAAAIVRHLLTDPVLPAELLPADWPGAGLRAAYNDFAAELIERRDGIRLVEAT